MKIKRSLKGMSSSDFQRAYEDALSELENETHSRNPLDTLGKVRYWYVHGEAKVEVTGNEALLLYRG